MLISCRYSIGDHVRTRNGTGKIVAVSASEGRTVPLFITYRVIADDGSQTWCPEFKIEEVIGW